MSGEGKPCPQVAGPRGEGHAAGLLACVPASAPQVRAWSKGQGSAGCQIPNKRNGRAPLSRQDTRGAAAPGTPEAFLNAHVRTEMPARRAPRCPCSFPASPSPCRKCRLTEGSHMGTRGPRCGVETAPCSEGHLGPRTTGCLPFLTVGHKGGENSVHANC